MDSKQSIQIGKKSQLYPVTYEKEEKWEFEVPKIIDIGSIRFIEEKGWCSGKGLGNIFQER